MRAKIKHLLERNLWRAVAVYVIHYAAFRIRLTDACQLNAQDQPCIVYTMLESNVN
jgi:hypothetical protein